MRFRSRLISLGSTGKMVRQKFYKRVGSFTALLVGGSATTVNQHRFILKSIGFQNVLYTPSFEAAIEEAANPAISHVLFEARQNDAGVQQFINEILTLDPTKVVIPITQMPDIDEVLTLLRAGARGVLVSPLTLDVVENMLIIASNAHPAKMLGGAGGRNRIFSEIILNNLYHLALAKRYTRTAPQLEGYIGRWSTALRKSVELAKSYCEEGPESLRNEIVEACLARAEAPANRMSRSRGRKRQKTV